MQKWCQAIIKLFIVVPLIVEAELQFSDEARRTFPPCGGTSSPPGPGRFRETAPPARVAASAPAAQAVAARC